MIASIIFLAFFDYISGVIPKNHNNQAHLAPEIKVKSRPGGPLKADDSLIIPNSPGKKKEDEIFVGLFTQTEMEFFFKHKKNNYDNIKALVEAWCGDVWNLLEKVWKENEEQRLEADKEIKKKEKAPAIEAQRKLELWQAQQNAINAIQKN